MNAKERQLYGDMDDLLTYAGGYLIALKQNGTNDKLVKMTERTINKISKRHKKAIDKLYEPAKPRPDSISFKG